MPLLIAVFATGRRDWGGQRQDDERGDRAKRGSFLRYPRRWYVTLGYGSRIGIARFGSLKIKIFWPQ